MDVSAGEVAREFIQGELGAERVLKSSLETRGSTIITTSGALVTLLFGLAAVVTKSPNFVLPEGTHWLLVVAAALFISAAVLGIVVNAPISYLRVVLDDIAVFVTTRMVWDRDGVEVDRQLTHAQLVELVDVRRRNQTKGWLVVAAMSAQATAALLTAIVIGVVLAKS